VGETMTLIKQNKSKSLFRKAEKGQSMVELAMSITILFILLSGIVDIGRAIFVLFTLQDAAEEGVVYGVGFPTDCNQIIDRISANLGGNVLPDDINVKVNIQRNDGSYSTCYVIPYAEVYAGKKLVIEVSTDFQITMPFLGAFVGQHIPLKATANGVILRPQPPET
jgi:hypothetical protein